MTLPLDGIRILALEQFGAGPFGSLHLADLGAEVIKIEDPGEGGDVGRYIPPYAEGEDSLFFETFNRGKKSISLDLSGDQGRAIFDRLVARSDAVYSNLRGDVPSKIGIDYASLKHLNSAIVCCSLSGFGMTGPRRGQPGYDVIMQGMSGWMDITGEPGGPPSKAGLSVVDFSAGYVAALALLAGIHGARRDGVGMDCDVSLFDTAINMLTYPGVWHLNAGFEPTKTVHSAHPSVVPFQAFEASDGWMVVAAAKDKFFARIAEAVSHPEWATDPRFSTLAGRHDNSAVLVKMLGEEFGERTVDYWLERLGAMGVPCGPVNSVAQALADPQVEARGLVVEADHPRYGTVKTLASPVRVGSERTKPRRAPQRGEDTNSVLAEVAAMSHQEIERARIAGAFG